MEFHEVRETWEFCDALDRVVAQIQTPGVVNLFQREIGNLRRNGNGGNGNETVCE